MTENQKNHITQLRKAGMGYGAIAKELGIAEGNIKYFCKVNNISPEPGYSSDSSFCRNCGKPITSIPGRKPRQFCSRECGLIWWHSHPEKSNRKAFYSYTCAYCGKPFTAYGKPNRKYCSLACSGASKSKEAKNEAE